ncbi:MAG: hypothetical protein A2X86_01870 [Bdellovibrionales bacterium GWA2_49_15]|nr:MAG: hypothetical protein A2X86_01870 [Bdellovibrionales bacterium GWA2_49_15]
MLMSLRFLLLSTVILGFGYPILMSITGSIFFPAKTSGSLLMIDGKVRGSSLIAQQFKDSRYFSPRPSKGDFSTLPALASNYAPTSKNHLEQVQAWIKEHPEYQNTPEMLTYSGSGLDPHVSVTAIMVQLPRVIKARNLNNSQQEQLKQKIQILTEGPWHHILGQERINVLTLNLAMDQSGM